MKEGVKIFFNFKTSLKNRIWLSEGTQKAVGMSDEYEYIDNAIVPQKPWRLATDEEVSMLVSKEKPSFERFSENIVVLKLPKKTIDKLKKHKIEELKSREEVQAFSNMNNPVFRESVQEISSFVSKYQIAGERRNLALFFVEKQNLEVVTLGFEHPKKRVGMHIDIRSQKTLFNTHEGTNLILINLGKQQRYFVFINQPVKHILNWIQQKKGSVIDNDYGELICKDFQECFPNYEVTKICINPYEAYIAPTENIIHDGCTDGTSEPSIKCMIEGYFWV